MAKKQIKHEQKRAKLSKNGIIFLVLIALFILALIFDNSLFVAIQQLRISLNLPFNLNFIESYWFYAIIFVLSIIFILLDTKIKSKKKSIFRYLIGVVIVSLITFLLKSIVARPRPIPSSSPTTTDNQSFPSGHTTFMFSTLPFLKNWLEIVWLVLSLIIAIERIWQGAHFPSDVVAGILIGYFIPILTTRLINKITKSTGPRARRNKNKTNKARSKK